jgi:CRP/FNR family cyclic AMP-dependent transcriptional regulator
VIHCRCISRYYIVQAALDDYREVRAIPFSVKEEARMLSGVDFLEPLSKDDLVELAARCPDHHYGPGDILSTPREAGERFFIVKQGRVRVYELGPEGREQTLTEIGEASAFAAQRLNGAYTQALEQTTILSIGREDLKELIRKNPEAGMKIIERLVENLRSSESRLADISLKEVPARLASLILQLCESEGVVIREGYKIPTRYTHERLGHLIGARRVAVSRAFKELKETGAVQLRDRYIYIKDLDPLKRQAKAKRGINSS